MTIINNYITINQTNIAIGNNINQSNVAAVGAGASATSGLAPSRSAGLGAAAYGGQPGAFTGGGFAFAAPSLVSPIFIWG